MKALGCALLFLLMHYAVSDEDRQPPEDPALGSDDSPAVTDPSELQPRRFLRKCCPFGKLYQRLSNDTLEITIEKCRDHAEPRFASISQQLLYGRMEPDALETGFPDCEKTMIRDQPHRAKGNESFYLLADGELVIPSRFLIYPLGSYCVEDLYTDNYDSTVSRVAIVCRDKARKFPSEAVDGVNTLQLSFLGAQDKMPGLASLSGLSVVRKCCDLDEVLWVQNRTCLPKQDYGTGYFTELLNSNENLFARIGTIYDCRGRDAADEFEWDEDWKLIAKMFDDDQRYLVDSDDYCIDDMVFSPSEDELPDTLVMAGVCPVWNRTKTSSTTENPSHAVNTVNETDNTIQDAASTASDVKKISTLPKCCPREYVVSDDGLCEKYEQIDQLGLLEKAVLHLVEKLFPPKHNFTLRLVHNYIFVGSYIRSLPLDQTLSNDTSAGHLFEPEFQPLEGNETLFQLKHHEKEHWAHHDAQMPYYCVDTERTGNSSLLPKVFFRPLPSIVSYGYTNVLLCISIIGLLITVAMYFVTPVKVSGGKEALATLVANRNFLCHISSLCLAFICVVIGQQLEPGKPECIAIGYVTYGAVMASFCWFTAYWLHLLLTLLMPFLARSDAAFLSYSLFGWGVPIVAQIIALVVQFQQNPILPAGSINPDMGLLHSWFGNDTSVLVFFYVPICFVLSLSTIILLGLLMVDPSLRCCKAKEEDSQHSKTVDDINKKKKRNRQRSKTIVDIFYFVTGVAWMLEIATWMLLYFTKVPNNEEEYLRQLFEVGHVLNSLRGVFVFVFFVLCQHDVRGHFFLLLKKGFFSCITAGALIRLQSQTNHQPTLDLDSSRRTSSATNYTGSTSLKSSLQTSPPASQPTTPISIVQELSFEPDESIRL